MNYERYRGRWRLDLERENEGQRLCSWDEPRCLCEGSQSLGTLMFGSLYGREGEKSAVVRHGLMRAAVNFRDDVWIRFCVVGSF